MKYPMSTGTVASLIGTTEPRLNDLIRRGRIHPAPVVVAGRRAWGPEQVRQAEVAVRAATQQQTRPDREPGSKGADR